MRNAAPGSNSKTRLFKSSREAGESLFANQHEAGESLFAIDTVCFAGLAAHAGAFHPIPSRTRPLNPPAAMILRPKARESSPLPSLPSTRPQPLLTAPGQRAQSPEPNAPEPHKARITFIAGWSSPVARQAHNLKAAGSNPAPAPKHKSPPRRQPGGLLLVGAGRRLRAVQDPARSCARSPDPAECPEDTRPQKAPSTPRKTQPCKAASAQSSSQSQSPADNAAP